MATFEEIQEVFKQWLYLDHDPDVLRIIFAVYVANKYDGLPVWAMLIGKPGCGKSELLSSLVDAGNTVMVSTLTPNSFATGHVNGESLLNLLKDNKMLIVKDMSTFTELQSEARGMIFATLRDAYDGNFVRRTGVVNINWSGKFGMLCGATPAIEKVRSYDTALGERFLNIKFNSTEEDERIIQERSYQNYVKQTEMRKALKDITAKFFKTVQVNKNADIPLSVVRSVMYNARGLVKARSSISRDRFSREVDEMVSTSEVPTRVTNQLMLIARACLDMKTDEATINRIIQRLCIDSIPSARVQVMKYLVENGAMRAADLKPMVRMSPTAIERVLEDLWFLKLASVDLGKNYTMSDETMKNALINTGVVKLSTSEDPM